MINKFSLDKKNEIFKLYSLDGEDCLKFNNLSQVNIFVGANNSGKSLFLRELVLFANTINYKKNYDNNYYNEPLSYSVYQITKSHFENKFDELKEILKKDNIKDLNTYVTKIEQYLAIDKEYFNENDIWDIRLIENIYQIEIFKIFLDNFLEKIKDCYPFNTDLPNVLYLPIFRTTRKLGEIEYINGRTARKSDEATEYPKSIKDNNIKYFKNRVSIDYFKHVGYKASNQNRFVFIYTGENINKFISEKKNSYSVNRKLISEFEFFLKNTFFNNQKIELTVINGELYIEIGIEKERPIYELGDGIQSLIILLFPVFMNKDKDFYYFIEEPELNLHPGMQRVFIETLEKFPKTQVFITTHSNHFLDMSMENDNISIYSFQKDKIDETKGEEQDASFQITTLNSTNVNILNQLGVRNSSVFLSNCTIWVEGITDRLYIKKFLELYVKHENKKNFLEDFHYSFVEYAGSNITHWNFYEDNKTEQIFAKSISNKIFLIADSDVDEKGKPLEAKKERFERLGKELNNNFSLLPCKEIENILSPKTIKGVVADYEKTEIDKIEIRNIDKINDDPYIYQNLGKFIDENLDSKKRKTYASNNTISDKTGFCNRAIKVMTQNDFLYSDLSKKAKNLCTKIYKFIELSNKN